MPFFQRDWIPLAAILFATLAAFLAYDHLPRLIPIHWGIDGRIDSYAPKKWGAYRYPGFMAVIYLFFRLIPYIDRGRIRQLREIGIYDPLRNGAVLLFGYAHLLSLGIGIGWFSPEANTLIGSLALLVLFSADRIRRTRSSAFCRFLNRLGIAPSPPARHYLFRGLTCTGVCGLIGPFTGRIQTGWLLLPLLASLILTRRRFPADGGPAS